MRTPKRLYAQQRLIFQQAALARPKGVQPVVSNHRLSAAFSFSRRLSPPKPFEPTSFQLVLRHEVARLIVWQAVSTRPVVPSTVSYVVRQHGNALSNAHGQSTHSHPTGTRTARERCLCQPQAETGLGWTGW